jgi:prephenate dehydrogenase
LTRFRTLLAQKDGAAMEAMFSNAQRARNEWHARYRNGVEAADAKSKQDNDE